MHRLLPVCSLLPITVAVLLTSPGAAATPPPGAIAEVVLSPATAGPRNIITGPDRALWFTETADHVARLTTSGTLTQFPLPGMGVGAEFLVTGPDGAVWLTERYRNAVARITPAGHLTEYSASAQFSRPAGIAVGSDGALWYAEAGANRIGRMTTAGVRTNEYALSPQLVLALSSPDRMAPCGSPNRGCRGSGGSRPAPARSGCACRSESTVAPWTSSSSATCIASSWSPDRLRPGPC